MPVPSLEEPLLPTFESSLQRFRRLSAALFASSPLRIAESLDYELHQSKVHPAALRDEPKRRFYGYGGDTRGLQLCPFGFLTHPHIHRYTGHTLGKFIVTMLTGIVVGGIAVLLTSCINLGLDTRNAYVQAILSSSEAGDAHAMWIAFAFMLGSGLVCVLTAALMVQLWAPTAAGAGVSLVMAYLNGNDVRGCVGGGGGIYVCEYGLLSATCILPSLCR